MYSDEGRGVKAVTKIVAAGQTFNTPVGMRGCDFDYEGTNNPPTITGGNEFGFTSDPVNIPAGKPYTLEFNQLGYKTSFLVDNSAGDGDLQLVMKW